VAPAGVIERFLPPSVHPQVDATLVYQPAILGAGSLHYVRATAQVDLWVDFQFLLPCGHGLPAATWESASEITEEWPQDPGPRDGFGFAELSTELLSKATYQRLEGGFKDYLYRHHPLTIFRAPALKKFAPPGVTEGEARVHFTQDLRELRDRETERIRAKYVGKAQSLEKSIRTAAEKLDRERAALNQASIASVIELGTSVIGTFFGGKRKSRASSSSASSVLKGATQAARKKADAGRAEEALRQMQLDLNELQVSLQAEIDRLIQSHDVHRLELEVILVRPRKADLKARPLVLLWTPWQIDPQGNARPLYETIRKA
jgi:hypothetical protein